MVIAPAARARLKKAPMAGSGISNWLTAMSPFASDRRGDIGRAHQRIGAGNDDDGVVGVGGGDDGRSGMRPGRCLHEAQVDSLCAEERLQLVAERILAEPADQRRRCAEFCGGYRLVGALAAGKIEQRGAGDGFADAGMPVAVATTSMLMLPATNTRPMRLFLESSVPRIA